MSKVKPILILALIASLFGSSFAFYQITSQPLPLSEEALASIPGFIPADSVYAEDTSSKNCNPGQWCAIIDWGGTYHDYEGEMTFDISSLSGEMLESAEVCAYRHSYYLTGEVTNYIEKLDSSVCSQAPFASAPGSWQSGIIPNTADWHCIDVTDMLQQSIDEGDSNFYIRWWGNDLNGATSPYSCFMGPAQPLVDCGGSNPSGGPGCMPYLRINNAELPPIDEIEVSVNSPAEVAEGSNFTVSIDVTEMENYDSSQFDLTYNPAVIEFINATDGLVGGMVIPFAGSGFMPSGVPGTVRILNLMPLDYLDGVDGSGYLSQVNFHVIGSASDTSELSLSEVYIANTSAEIIPSISIGSSIHVYAGAQCQVDADCDDDLYCNGEETCESGICVAGTAPDCDDSVGCTVDTCNEATDSCDNTPDDGLCDDGLWCNGSESCDALLDCQAGTSVDCSGNNIAPIGTCGYTPDDNPFTWDYFAGFTSTCNEADNECTSGSISLNHTCSVADCSAQCDASNECADTDCDYLDGCVGDDYYDYNDVANACQGDCSCTGNACGAPTIYEDDSRCTNSCPTPPASPTNFRGALSGINIVLTWNASPSPDVASYNIYTSATLAGFDFSTPADTVAAGITTWTDTTAGSASERYYIVRAEDTEGTEEENTSKVGKFDIDLYKPAGKTGQNFISLFFESDITTAEELGQDIPNCDTVTKWDPLTQQYSGHPVGTGFNNFNLTKGSGYLVSVTQNTTWTQVFYLP